MSSASIGNSGESLGRKKEIVAEKKIVPATTAGFGSGGALRKAIRGVRSFLFPAEELQRENRRIYRALRGHDAEHDSE